MAKVKIHEIPGYIQTMYLVEYPDKLLLLDSGCSTDVLRVKDYIENILKRSFTDLKLVIVTHAHPDHSGGAMIYKEKYGINIAGPKEINEWYGGPKGFITYLVDILLTYMVARRKKAKWENIFFKRKLVLDYHLSDQKEIPGFEDWMCLETPGHISFDLSIWHPETKQAYIADNLVSSRLNVFAPYPIFLPQVYKSSLKRYVDIELEEVLLSHYGRHKLDKKRVEQIIASVADIPRHHTNTLPKILKRLLKG